MQRFHLASVLITAALAAGCAGTVGYSAGVSGEAYGPDLVYAAPGVQVIADYDEPIFYSDGFYWRSDGNLWYRSSNYSGGWAYAAPPQAVLRIERPREYVHYRPQGWSPRARRPQPGPVVRDHRDERRFEPAQPPPRREGPPPRHEGPPQRDNPPPRPPGPPGHDRRDERRDDHRDERDHRR